MKQVCYVILILLVVTFAHAVSISGTGGVPTTNAYLTGGTMINFDTNYASSISSVSISGVTFTALGGTFNINNVQGLNYNVRGVYGIDNPSGINLRFNFSTTVSAFAFNFGASDVVWTLRAYNASGTLLDSLSIAAVHSSNNGEFFGIAAAGISYATLTADSSGDYVLLDNFTFKAAPVPEPSSFGIVLLLSGLYAAYRKSR